MKNFFPSSFYANCNPKRPLRYRLWNGSLIIHLLCIVHNIIIVNDHVWLI
jgi:hypothetical protein